MNEPKLGPEAEGQKPEDVTLRPDQGSAAPRRTEEGPKPDVLDVNKLTPEEQMARFEDDLKEKDWGHQPC